MTIFRFGVLSVLGASVAGLIVLAAVRSPSKDTSRPQAILVPNIETSAGGNDGYEGEQHPRLRTGAPTVTSLIEDFDALGYDLDAIASGSATVPRVFFTSLPVDIGGLRDPEAQRALFFKFILPLVLSANEEILADRQRLWDLRYRIRLGGNLSAVDRLWLKIVTERYQVPSGDLDELARRMDMVPPSLALAQAAEGSDWGTSGLVREGNALFGKGMASDRKGPTAARQGAKRPTFDSLLDSVRAYMLTLNTQPAYQAFRETRDEMRHAGTPLIGAVLVRDLGPYSPRDDTYVQSIEKIIEVNGLRPMDGAQLQPAPAEMKPST